MVVNEDRGTPVADSPRVAGRFSALPPRIELADMIESVDASGPPNEPSSDPNREVVNRWGAGLI